jgi:hypothetical protein
MTPPAPPQTMTRDDLIRMGQTRPPWEFIPLGVMAHAQIPQDHALTLLIIGAYAKLQLRTPAIDLLETLRGEPSCAEQVQALDPLLASLPDDRITIEALEAALHGNVEALRAREIDLTPHIDAWRTEASALKHFRTGDGNIVIRRAGDQGWVAFRPDAQQAEAAPLPHLTDEAEARKQYIIEGINPPHLLQRIWRTTPQPDGFANRINIVQRDAAELITALALADLTDLIADPRVRFFAGDDAAASLRMTLESELHLVVDACTISMQNVRTPLVPAIRSIVDDASARQAEEHQRLRIRIDERYEPRDLDWWRARYESGAPLRVLIPVSRFSTFIRHSAEDLIDALRAAGHDGCVLTEPDDCSRLTTPAYYRAILDYDPDLIVCFNFTRTHMQEAMPANLPFATWIQDRMLQLFDPEVGRAIGRFDFVTGHVHKTLYRDFGYPMERILGWSVPVNTRKFSGAPLPESDVAPYRCELAYVSHRSESPAAMHDRLRPIAQGDQRIERTLDELYESMPGIAERMSSTRAIEDIHQLAIDALRRHGFDDPPFRLIDSLFTSYVDPLAEQILRHQTLEWAADLCDRRGWRLRIYGNGWDRHERFAPCAAAPVEHGDQLQAAYQGAIAHLHMSLRTNLHQRVMECFASGGLMLARLNYAEALQHWRHQERGLADVPPRYCCPNVRWVYWDQADYPPITEARDLLERLGVLHPKVRSTVALSPARLAAVAQPVPERAEHTIFTHAASPELWMFDSPQALERRLEWAIESPTARRELIRRNRARIAGAWSYDAFAADLLDFVRRGLRDELRIGDPPRFSAAAPVG